jgi:hypothetical protein
MCIRYQRRYRRFSVRKGVAAFTAQDAAAGKKLSSIFERTDEVWKNLEAFVGAGCSLTLLLGNHDIELSLPTPRRILLDRLGPGRIEFIYDNQAFVDGLIEHGNRYDSWNVIAHDQLREVRSAMSLEIHREHGRDGDQGIMPSVSLEHVGKKFGDSIVVEDFDLSEARARASRPFSAWLLV